MRAAHFSRLNSSRTDRELTEAKKMGLSDVVPCTLCPRDPDGYVAVILDTCSRGFKGVFDAILLKDCSPAELSKLIRASKQEREGKTIPVFLWDPHEKQWCSICELKNRRYHEDL